MKNSLPNFLKVFFWSYDFYRLDKKKDKRLIIKNILEYGNKEAVNWLRKTYSEDEIKNTIKNSVKTEWSKKSLNYWSLIYEVQAKESRF